MDLEAFANIDRLDEIAKKNGICIPRTRGYRLMSEEQFVTEDEIKEMEKDMDCDVYERAVRLIPSFNFGCGWIEFSLETDRVAKKYLIKKRVSTGWNDENGVELYYNKTVGIRWDIIHGKKRKNLKFELKKARRRVRTQIETYNKYCGRDDILYIHAKIGSWAWREYSCDWIEAQPWFLEKVDDAHDSVYCDIYAKIDPSIM